MSPLLIYLSLFSLTICGLALWKGGPGERITAIVILSLLVIERLVRLVLPGSSLAISLALDALPALILLFLALRFASPWLGGVMLFYALQFALQSFYLVTERPHDDLHAYVNNLNFLGIHACLVIGTIMTWRQRRRQAAARGS